MVHNTLIISRTDIQQCKLQLANSSKNEKINQSIKNAQILDLKPLLGVSLYNAVLKDVSEDGGVYNDLLNGVEYEYNGVSYYSSGIKSMLSYYAYGRYIMWGDVVDNPFGATRKASNVGGSGVLDYATKKSFYQNYREIAFNLWIEVKRYIIYTNDPLFCPSISKASGGFKIKKISRL